MSKLLRLNFYHDVRTHRNTSRYVAKGPCHRTVLWPITLAKFSACNDWCRGTTPTCGVETFHADEYSGWTMMTSSKGNIFRVTGHLCREFASHQWIPRSKASDADLWCFLWSVPDKPVSKQSYGWWFDMPLRSLWRNCNDSSAICWKTNVTSRENMAWNLINIKRSTRVWEVSCNGG